MRRKKVFTIILVEKFWKILNLQKIPQKNEPLESSIIWKHTPKESGSRRQNHFFQLCWDVVHDEAGTLAQAAHWAVKALQHDFNFDNICTNCRHWSVHLGRFHCLFPRLRGYISFAKWRTPDRDFNIQEVIWAWQSFHEVQADQLNCSTFFFFEFSILSVLLSLYKVSKWHCGGHHVKSKA